MHLDFRVLGVGVYGTFVAIVAFVSQDEDYDRAASIKNEIARIRSVLSAQLAESGVSSSGAPGFADGSLSAASSSGIPTTAPAVAHQHNQVHSVLGQPSRAAGSPTHYSGVNRAPPAVDTSDYSAASTTAASTTHRPPSRPIRPAPPDALERALQQSAADGDRDDANTSATAKALSPPPRRQRPMAVDAVEAPSMPRPQSPSETAAATTTPEGADPSALSGVEGAASLPAPDQLPSGVASSREIAPLIAAFGSYVTAAALSKPWALRDAAMVKMALELAARGTGVLPNATPSSATASATTADELLSAVLTLVARTADSRLEKISAVFSAAATRLLPAALKMLGPAVVAGSRPRAQGVPHHTVVGAQHHGFGAGSASAVALDALLTALVDRLGDNTQRVREAAVAAVLEVSGCLGGDAIRKTLAIHSFTTLSPSPVLPSALALAHRSPPSAPLGVQPTLQPTSYVSKQVQEVAPVAVQRRAVEPWWRHPSRAAAMQAMDHP